MAPMFPNQKNSKVRLDVAPETSLVETAVPPVFPLLGETLFHGLPALPRTLIHLEWALSATVADLQDITDIIRSDIGLTAQLLRLAAREPEGSREGAVAIG